MKKTYVNILFYKYSILTFFSVFYVIKTMCDVSVKWPFLLGWR